MNSQTRNPEMQIATDGYFESYKITRIHYFSSSFCPPSGSWLGFWMNLELNSQLFDIQTWATGWQPQPIANTSINVQVEDSED